MILAQPEVSYTPQIAISVVIFAGTFVAARIGLHPLMEFLARQRDRFDTVLRGQLLMSVSPQAMQVLVWGMMVLIGFIGYMATGSVWGGVLFFGFSLLLPGLILKILRRRRIKRLEDQLVGAVQTLASGVRAGLNLVQAMQMIARDGPEPICDEFAHLLREYEYGVPLDEAMQNAADRIDSGDFRMLFAALHTHRERGGDLGETLDRIAASVREIQRLEKRILSLTAQGRATARWLGAMPALVLLILYILVDPAGVRSLFISDMGKVMLGIIIALNVVGFLWIRKIVAIDV
jgi:tight adherence protein B